MKNTKWKKLAFSSAVGGVAGFIVIFGLMRFIQTGLIGEIDGSRQMAAFAGAMYLLCGAIVGIGALNPKIGASFLNVEDADELQDQAVVLRYSALGIVALGLILLLLAFAAPIGPIAPNTVAFGIAGLLGVSVLTALRSMKLTDELNVSVARETAATAFYLMLAVGGGWSALAHLGFVAALAPLDWITLFAAMMLAGAFWASGRRGLLIPR